MPVLVCSTLWDRRELVCECACVYACAYVCLASVYVCVHTPYIFSLSGSWTKLPRSLRMRDKRADFVVGSLGGNIVAIGGLGNQPCPLASVESFSLARRRWEALPAMPTARCSCSSLQAGPRLFVIGGVAQGPSQAVEALCLRDGV